MSGTAARSEGESQTPARLSTWLGPTVLLAALLAAGVAVFLRAQQAVTGNLWGMPLDDAYIHFQFARNLATGHGFAFNPDQPVPASTSPLWVVLLALAYLVGAPLWLAAKVYGVAFLFAAGILAWRLALRVFALPLAALGVGALTMLDARLLWAAPSGMEVTLFAALSLAAFMARPGDEAELSRSRARMTLTALLCGLATLARPEGYLLTAVLAVDLYRRFRPSALSEIARAAWPAAAVYLVLALPYPAFALATTGHPLPTTYYAKASGLGPATPRFALQYVLILAYYLFTTNPGLLILAPVGAAVLWREGGESRALAAWPLLLIAQQALFSPLLYHFGRYSMPLDPFFALWGVAALVRLTRIAPGGDAWRMALPPLALMLVGVLTLNGWAGLYALSVQNIDDMHVTLGRWARTHIAPGVPIALNDVGAISFVSGHPAVDIVGLVTPRFIALGRESPPSRRGRDVYRAIKHERARYLIVFPHAYPWLVAQSGLHRVYSITLRRPLIVPDGTMTVYKLTP